LHPNLDKSVEEGLRETFPSATLLHRVHTSNEAGFVVAVPDGECFGKLRDI